LQVETEFMMDSKEGARAALSVAAVLDTAAALAS
jgi:hypothetical protein